MVCFSYGRSGHGVSRCPSWFPLFVAGIVGGTPGWSVPGSLAKENAETVSVGKRRLIRVGWSASRISNTSGLTDPGGGSSAAPNRASEPVWAFLPADSGQHCWTSDKQSYPLLSRQRADQSTRLADEFRRNH